MKRPGGMGFKGVCCAVPRRPPPSLAYTLLSLRDE